LGSLKLSRRSDYSRNQVVQRFLTFLVEVHNVRIQIVEKVLMLPILFDSHPPQELGVKGLVHISPHSPLGPNMYVCTVSVHKTYFTGDSETFYYCWTVDKFRVSKTILISPMAAICRRKLSDNALNLYRQNYYRQKLDENALN
jgi:hypothetical protein